MDRKEVLHMTSEKINELAESVRDELEVSKPEEIFGTILICLTRQFKAAISVRELAYGLNSVAAMILENSSDEDKLFRQMFPRMPDGFKPTDN